MTEGRLSFDCTPGAAQRVADLVSRIAERASLTSQQQYWLRLAADEITTNIASHGYQGSAGTVVVDSAIERDRVWIRIEDSAPAFDPCRYRMQAQSACEPLGTREGGFGLMLALHNLDDFIYEYECGRNRNTLVMRRPAAPDTEGTGYRDG